jgi:PAS domain S-box-containing protein
MKQIWIIGILFLNSLFTFSSETTHVKDSLLLIRHVDSLVKVAEMSLDNNNKLAKYAADEAYTWSIRLKYIQGQINSLSTLAKVSLANEDYVNTLKLYFKIIDLYDQNHDTACLLVQYSRVAQFFLLIKDYELAEKYIAMMTRLAQKSSDPATQGQVMLSHAQYFKSKGEYDLAIRNLYLSILYFQKTHDPMLIGACYKFLGDAFKEKKLYSKAEYTYRVAISFYARIPNPTEIAVIYTRIAHINQVLGKNKLNLEYNLTAMRIREKSGRPFFIASSYLNVGEAYWLLDRKDSARYYLQKSLQLAERIKKTDLLEAIYSQLSIFAEAEHRYADALKYFMTCIEYRTKINHDRDQKEFLTLEANRTIRSSEVQNDLLNQEIMLQDLQIVNRRIKIFLFEVAFLVMLSLILIVDSLARKNRKRKDELKELNKRLKNEINIRIEAEGRLNRSEELHQFLAENTVDVISLMDAGMNRLYISPSCEKFYGYSAQEILQMHSPLELVEPSFHVTVNQHLLEMFRSKNPTRYIYKVLRKNGSSFWAEANINPIVDPATKDVKSLITVVRDVSERMKHEEDLSENARQKEYLLREIHNRVKNNFAILISLMNMQRDQSANLELSNSLTDLQLRVRTMSLVHEQLYQTQEISTIPFDNYLHHLALIISTSFNNDRIRLKTEICPCSVAIEMALPLGLILNELITNAYKYAFPDDRTGNIWVRLLPESGKKFCISVSDDGIGLPPDFNMNTTQSMGTQIVGILVEQIEANLEVSNNDGACFRILFSTAQEK